jgi:hypothetical protein
MSEFERLLSAYCDEPSGNTWRFVTGSMVTGACEMSPPVLHPTMMGAFKSGNASRNDRENVGSRSFKPSFVQRK